MTFTKFAAASTVAAFAFAAAPVFAEDTPVGDPAAGEEVFAKNCVSCHVVVNDAGETLAGRNAKTGPNLYKVSGRVIGSIEDFRYGDGIEALHEQGVRWNEEEFVGYVQDPTGWLRETTDNKRVRGKMSFKLRDVEDAQNVWSYLYSLGHTEEGS